MDIHIPTFFKEFFELSPGLLVPFLIYLWKLERRVTVLEIKDEVRSPTARTRKGEKPHD